MSSRVLVLMSTYNGEKYLREQLESLLSQRDVDINILVRDDGSTDQTIDIIKKYVRENSNIELVEGDNIGYARSFWWLLCNSDYYEYYAFCDQDDIWNCSKLMSAINKIKEYRDQPALYTSRVVAVDNALNVVSSNCFNSHSTIDVYTSLTKNILPGCVYVFNQQAKIIASQYTGYMESHDWALYTIVSIFGKVVYDDNSYIFYRLHNNNTIGKKNIIQDIIQKVGRLKHKSICTRSSFAKGLLDCYDLKRLNETIYMNIYLLANYQESVNYKMRLICRSEFHGFIFKLYVLLNRV